MKAAPLENSPKQKPGWRFSLKAATLAVLLASALAGAADIAGDPATDPQPAPVRANCELRMAQPSQAGSLYLSTVTTSEEECLKLQDGKTKASFRTPIARKSPNGPRE